LEFIDSSFISVMWDITMKNTDTAVGQATDHGGTCLRLEGPLESDLSERLSIQPESAAKPGKLEFTEQGAIFT